MNTNQARVEENRNTLRKALGRTDVIAIGFGTMIGWSWIVMAASWVTGAGYLGAIIAFLVGGAIILAIGMTYGELTAALPLAGGEFVFAYRAIGKIAGFITGWVMTLAYLGVAAWEGIALATAINYLIPIPKYWLLWEIAGYKVYFSWSLIGMAGALLLMVLNIIGLRPAVLFQVMATAAIMVIVLIILLGGMVFGDRDNIGEMFSSSTGFMYVMFMVPAMLIGFDVIPQSAEEMNISKRNIGKMIIVCIIMSIIWYCFLIIGIGLAAPAEIRTSGILPIADITAYLFNGDMFSVIIVIGGILGIMTTWNGFFLGATRLIFAMGRARIIPSVFSYTGPRNRTPSVAVITVGIVCMLAPLMGKNALIWLIDTSSLCALLAYSLVTGSFLRLRMKEPELERPFHVLLGKTTGITTFAVTCTYTAMYIVVNVIDPGNAVGFTITAIWMLAGTILYIGAGLERRHLSAEEQELLVFGKAFARNRGDMNE